MKYLFFVAIIFVAFAQNGFTQSVIQAVRVSEPPVIDGYVNEKVWDEAFAVDELYQREPFEGKPISKKTIFYTCYDANNIYFAVKCWDDPAKITAKEMARDVSLGKDDRIQIIIDTYNDKRNGYWFQIGPRGSIGDAIVNENGAVLNKEWDGLWVGKAKITDWGWQAEIAIPFKTMGFDKNANQWGIKFIRNIVNNLESAYWPVANLNTYKFQVSDAGTLNGIENITQGIGLDIAPYLITGLNTKKDEKADPKLNAGVDLFYQVTPGLKSSLTINTDFAETEVDDRQINLTRFSLHYPEKRDFFLDGANNFRFGIESDDTSPVSKSIIPFFSRRMGLDSLGGAIPINAGIKLAGQIEKVNVGMMYINQDSEPGTDNFSVARLSHNIGKQSSVGIIGTYGNATGKSTNLVVGADMKLSTSTFQKNKTVSLFLFGLKSNTENMKGNDVSWGTQVVYPNDLIKARLGFHQIGKNFVAGMGFVPRTNISESYGSLTVGPRPNKWGIMQVEFGGGFDYITNFESGALETREFEIQPIGIRFLSGEILRYSMVSQYESLSKDFNIFENIVIPEGVYEWWQQQIKLETKGARKVWGDASYRFGNFYDGTRNDIKFTVNWKVAVPFFIGGTFSQNNVSLVDGDFSADIFQMNANILFSPNLTLYNYLQYDNASNRAGWQARLQWIIKPGNEIILAWTSSFDNSTDQFVFNEGAARLKIKYNIRF